MTFYVRVVGVAAALGRAVASMKGVLARGEEGGGVRGEELAGANLRDPSTPVCAIEMINTE